MAPLLTVEAPPRPLSFSCRDFDPDVLLEEKARSGSRVSVIIPARDEEETIGSVVETVAAALVRELALVDELVVVDDASGDDTGARASAAGARVVPGPGVGKGEAMAAGIASLAAGLDASSIVVFLDGDVTDLTPAFVTGLAGPLLCDDALELAKARYRRPIGGSPTGGGRVTELVAKPALELLFPELSFFDQPLAGETAVRGSLLEVLELAPGYAVEVAMLIDAARRVGPERLCEVDLGVRSHRNRALAALVPQAREVLAAILARSPR